MLSGVIITFCFPLISFPKDISPEISEIIAWSLGFLASNNSATRGNPPVISFVFEAAFGVLAKTSPFRGMEILEKRYPFLHYVRFKDENEKKEFKSFLYDMKLRKT